MRTQSLMTQYLNGSLVTRELQDMLNDYAAADRFDRETGQRNSVSNAFESMIRGPGSTSTAI